MSKDFSARGITSAILELVDPLELDPDNCIGFSFDGASVMSGEISGVQTRLKKIFKNAIYVHCSSHKLNLALQKIAEHSDAAKSVTDFAGTLYTYFGHPHRLEKLNEKQEERIKEKKAKKVDGRKYQLVSLARASKTKWSSNCAATDRVDQLIPSILDALDELLDDKDKEHKDETMFNHKDWRQKILISTKSTQQDTP